MTVIPVAAADDAVLTLDLREGSAEAAATDAYLDAIDARRGAPAGPPRRVLVLDEITGLMDHHERYERLAALPQVEKVVCVAVGALHGERTQPRLRIPTTMVTVAATLWVGEPVGVYWSGGPDRARVRVLDEEQDPQHPQDPRHPGIGGGTGGTGGIGLPDLLGVLRFPEVFDQMYRRTREFPHQIACPGLDVARIDVPEGVLTEHRVLALHGFVATGLAARGQQQVPSRLGDDLDRLVATLTGSSHGRGLERVPVGAPLQQARKEAHERLDRVSTAVQRLAEPAGLLAACAHVGLPRIHALCTEAGAALAEHHRLVTESTRRIGANLASGHPPVHELVETGLPQPSAVDHVALAAELGSAVSAELRSQRPVPETAEQLRRFAVRVAPQGAVSAAAPELSRLSSRVQALVTGLREPPPVGFGWPAPLLLLTVLALLTCLAATMLPQSNGAAGPVLTLCWILLTGVLLAGSSGRSGRQALAAAVDGALLVIAFVALLGVISGGLLAGAVDTSGLPVVAEVVVLAALVVVLLTTGVLSWRWMIQRWAGRIGVGAAVTANQQLVLRLDEVIAREWRPAQCRRDLADTAQVLASALDDLATLVRELRTVLEEQQAPGDGDGSRDGSRDGADGLFAAGPELSAVLRGDLAELAVLAIEPCLTAARRGGRLSAQPGQYVEHMRQLLTGYSGHLETHGVHVLPPGIRDEAPRRALRMALWQQSETGRQLLRRDHRSELVQFCSAGEVRLLSATDAEFFRFAPQDARDVFGIEDAAWASGTAVGVVRLVPLRLGLVEITPIACQPPVEPSASGDVVDGPEAHQEPR